ncbi:MAG: hypothetical protein JWN82_354 [Candidatus Saccharibacteria bacterium]|nr:hypothetical protein [Candidatus Saccharibacteria bacterium]
MSVASVNDDIVIDLSQAPYKVIADNFDRLLITIGKRRHVVRVKITDRTTRSRLVVGIDLRSVSPQRRQKFREELIAGIEHDTQHRANNPEPYAVAGRKKNKVMT